MASDEQVTHHSLRLRLTPVAALVAMICAALADVYLLRDLWLGLSGQLPGYAGPLLLLRAATAAVVGPALIILLAAVLRSTWFYLYAYRCSGSGLEALDRILRRKWFVEFRDVVTVRTLIVFGETVPGPSRVAHILVDKGGSQIKLSEALPLWQAIKERCGEAAFEERPMPWWEVRR